MAEVVRGLGIGGQTLAERELGWSRRTIRKGMLTRFTVEMHKLIDSDLVWKDGVILTDSNTRAEVIETYRTYALTGRRKCVEDKVIPQI